MPLSLPAPIADYFAADSADGAAVARCFTDDAVVMDEKQTHRGRESIARWKTEASAKYNYVSEPVDVQEQGDRIVVTARITGTFPGSPLNIRYVFVLRGSAIARLEILP